MALPWPLRLQVRLRLGLGLQVQSCIQLKLTEAAHQLDAGLLLHMRICSTAPPSSHPGCKSDSAKYVLQWMVEESCTVSLQLAAGYSEQELAGHPTPAACSAGPLVLCLIFAA